jgi:hypothetical protein
MRQQQLQEHASVPVVPAAAAPARHLPAASRGTQFTCFTGTKIQILPQKLRRRSSSAGAQALEVCGCGCVVLCVSVCVGMGEVGW